MPLLSSRLAEQFQRRTEAGFYGDRATYIRRTNSTADTFGQLAITTTSTKISCSFSDGGASESWKDYADVEQIDATIRFTAPVPAKGDQITLTGRYENSDYTDRTFEIVGIRDRGVLGYVCALRAVVL